MMSKATQNAGYHLTTLVNLHKHWQAPAVGLPQAGLRSEYSR